MARTCGCPHSTEYWAAVIDPDSGEVEHVHGTNSYDTSSGPGGSGFGKLDPDVIRAVRRRLDDGWEPHGWDGPDDDASDARMRRDRFVPGEGTDDELETGDEEG